MMDSGCVRLVWFEIVVVGLVNERKRFGVYVGSESAGTWKLGEW